MFIKVVDDALERLLRDQLPLPDEIGDVTFDSPTSNWSAQLSRVTVNLFLYDVTRSAAPTRPQVRDGANGHEWRGPLPMMQLSYLVSAWAGGPRDEHQLLGDVVSRLAAVQTVPAQYFGAFTPGSNVTLILGDDSANKAREVWSALGGQLKASFALHVTIAADSYDWVPEAPAVQRIEAITKPVPWHTVSRSQVVKK